MPKGIKISIVEYFPQTEWAQPGFKHAKYARDPVRDTQAPWMTTDGQRKNLWLVLLRL